MHRAPRTAALRARPCTLAGQATHPSLCFPHTPVCAPRVPEAFAERARYEMRREAVLRQLARGQADEAPELAPVRTYMRGRGVSWEEPEFVDFSEVAEIELSDAECAGAELPALQELCARRAAAAAV